MVNTSNTILLPSSLQSQGTSSLEMYHTEQNIKTHIQYLISMHHFHKYFEWWKTINLFAEYPNFRVSTNTLEGRMIRQRDLTRGCNSGRTPVKHHPSIGITRCLQETESNRVCGSPSEGDRRIKNDCSSYCVRKQMCQAGEMAVHVQGTR